CEPNQLGGVQSSYALEPCPVPPDWWELTMAEKTAYLAYLQGLINEFYRTGLGNQQSPESAVLLPREFKRLAPQSALERLDTAGADLVAVDEGEENAELEPGQISPLQPRC